MCRCVRDLTAANNGGNRVRRKDKNENIGSFDCGVDSLHEFFRRSDALPINPGFSASAGQGLIEAAHEILVFASVGNEDVRHFLSAFVLAILRPSLAWLTSKVRT